MAGEVLITISKEEWEQAWLRSREKYVLDTQSKLVQAKREGERKGRREGREDVAWNALAEGSSIEFVKKITGLDIETIKGIQKDNR